MRAAGGPTRALLLAAAVALLAPAAPAAAEDLRQIEAVGAVGVRKGERADPRAGAVAQALREAVERVASELLADAALGPEAEEGAPVDLAAVLGKDMGAYTSRFKVTEDRGLGPALFVEDPDVTTEYVVVVDALVDADLVRSRLVAAGALEPEAGTAESGVVLLEVEGLEVYPALADLRDLLERRVGAASALPREIEHGRATLEVRTSLDARGLAQAMEREAPPHMTIVPLGTEGSGRARIAVRWSPARFAPPDAADLPPVEAGRSPRPARARR